MILRFFKLSFFLTSFLFLTGFVPLPAVLGPAITVATSGNLVKATAQLVFDNEFKKKTGKSSLNYITEEVSKNNQENRINKDLKDQPKFTDDIGSKNQEHHTFEQGDQSILKKNLIYQKMKEQVTLLLSLI